MRGPLTPAPLKPSRYGVDPALVKKRAGELPGVTSVLLGELFPDQPPVVYPSAEGVDAVYRSTVEALSGVDMSMIQPRHSVNVLASHHGFTVLGGEPYAQMLRAMRDVVVQRTGCKNVRLRAGVGMRFRETEEYIRRFELDKHYEGKAIGVCPVDEGVAIETEIGTLYGIKKCYDADWIIQAHNSDVREVHFHRQVDRAVKCFAMSFARNETRSTYHHNVGPRVANFVARAIYESQFVQDRWAFSVFLLVAPRGIVGVDADNDLMALNDRVTASGLKYYGKIFTLFGAIDECIAVLDFSCPVAYVRAGEVIFANFVSMNVDLFDLDRPLPPYTWYTEAFYGKSGKPLIADIPPLNPALKTIVHNYAWGGYPHAFFAEHIPTVVVGREQADFMNTDPLNLSYMKYATTADSLETAVHFARHAARSEKLIIFDGAAGGVNVSGALAEYLTAKAPEVARRVEKELLPKWLKQRGIEPKVLESVA